MRGPALLLLLAALPAVLASCGESDDATALDLVIDARATIDQIDIRAVTLNGSQPVTLATHLLPHQPTPLHTGDVLRLLFDDSKGGSAVVVTAVGLYQGAAVTADAIAMGTLQTKHPVRATLVLGSGGTGGNGGAGGSSGGSSGSAGTAGVAGGGGATAGGGASGTGGVPGGSGGAGRGGTSGTAGAGGAGGGASGSGGVTGAAGRGGTGGVGGTSGGGRGGGTAGTGGTTGAAGRGGTGGTGTAGRGGTGGAGGTGTAGRGGTGGTGGAPRCVPGDALAQTAATDLPAAALGNITECGYTTMVGGVVKYAATNGSRFAFLRDLEFGQSAACGRCIQVMSAQSRFTTVTVVGSCTPIPGLCGGNIGLALSSAAYSDIVTGTAPFPVTWGYVPCQVQGVVYARLDATFTRVVIQNHAYGIAKVEVEDPAGGQPAQLLRSADNFWGAAGLALSGRTIRVTDVNGGVVTGTLQGSNAEQPLAAQLPMCLP